MTYGFQFSAASVAWAGSGERETQTMEKKLYRVKVVLYVMAENESEACVAATQARFDIFECVARKAESIEPGWVDAIPYNSNDSRTCSEILPATRKPPVRPPAAMVRADKYWLKEIHQVQMPA